jgi:hypothetical protein
MASQLFLPHAAVRIITRTRIGRYLESNPGPQVRISNQFRSRACSPWVEVIAKSQLLEWAGGEANANSRDSSSWLVYLLGPYAVNKEGTLLMSGTAASNTPEDPQDLVSLLSPRVVGQAAATRAISPYVYMYQSGLAPEGRQHETTPLLTELQLDDDDGLKLGLELRAQAPQTQIIMMTGGGLSADEVVLCGERDFPILFKPFLTEEVLSLVKGSFRHAAAGSP